jgi:hypothetical protein
VLMRLLSSVRLKNRCGLRINLMKLIFARGFSNYSDRSFISACSTMTCKSICGELDLQLRSILNMEASKKTCRKMGKNRKNRKTAAPPASILTIAPPASLQPPAPTLHTIDRCEESNHFTLFLDDIPFQFKPDLTHTRHDSKTPSILGEEDVICEEPDVSSLYSVYSDPPEVFLNPPPSPCLSMRSDGSYRVKFNSEVKRPKVISRAF